MLYVLPCHALLAQHKCELVGYGVFLNNLDALPPRAFEDAIDVPHAGDVNAGLSE